MALIRVKPGEKPATIRVVNYGEKPLGEDQFQRQVRVTALEKSLEAALCSEFCGTCGQEWKHHRAGSDTCPRCRSKNSYREMTTAQAAAIRREWDKQQRSGRRNPT